MRAIQSNSHLTSYENIGDAVARLGDASVVAECTRVFAISTEQNNEGASCPARLLCLPGAHMARSVGPVGSGRLCGFFEARPLVEVHSHGVLEDISVNAIIDLEFDRTHSLVNIHDCVCSGNCDIGEIKPPDFVA